MFRKFDTLQVALGGFALAIYLLHALSKRYPHVGWLQHFRDAFPRPSEEQRAKMRRRGNFYAGAQLILLGLALPLGYGALTMMTFSSFDWIEAVLAGSALCVVLGAIAIRQSWRG